MEEYAVKINGVTYNVEIEKVGGTVRSISTVPRTLASGSAPLPKAPVRRSEGTPISRQPVQTKLKPAPTASKPIPAAPKAAPEAPKPASAVSAGTASSGIRNVETGVTGKVFKIVAKPGDIVKRGQEILILEAMKMEIPIVAPSDGTVATIKVGVGDTVDSGQVLATLS